MPDAKIVLLGHRKGVQSTLWLPALRNSVHAVYLVLDDVNSGKVTVYSRCLFCGDEPGQVRVLTSWHLGWEEPKLLNLFPYGVRDFHGRLLRAVSLPFFPYADYEMNLKDLSKPVTLRDSLDHRILKTTSSLLNFTYEVYTPPDVKVGVPAPNGSWTGMIGVLQRGEVDITLAITITAGRLPFMDLARMCESDPVIITSLRPQLLPQYLVIVRPFTVNVWIYLVLSIMVWGTSLWLLEKMRSRLTGERSMTLHRAIFYSWAVVLDDPPPKPPKYSAGQILLGWWLVASLVISTGFRSSLVANLSIQSKTKPIDSYEDLLSQSNWHWGMHDTISGGQPNIRTNDQDPTLRKIYQKSESKSIEEGLEKILEGGYSFLITRTRVRTDIASKYTDKFGRTYLYISKQFYKILSDFGWGFRKGAPYYNLFVITFHRLIEAGLIDYWIEDAMAARITQIRRERKEAQTAGVTPGVDLSNMFEADEVILRTRHMMGVYLVTLAGFITAVLTFFAEKLIHRYNADFFC
ncbi:probable glutamate receptor [Macrobrachium rosenbergii]|uniref:probable glutamate receptor n=1 Tax=Macrobrachium rosenbergii TaxID=79674 RepID=UPI0034D79B6C